MYIGSEFRIDVSSEAGNRFDQNVTGFRAEEEFGFNATPLCRDRQVREDPRAVVPNMTRPRSGYPAGAFSVPALR